MCLTELSFLHQLVIVFVGIITGLGCACLYMPTIVLVTKHFHRSPGTAVALCGTGSSVGTFAIPPIIAFSADRYATPGMMMILSGVCLHLVLAAVIMTPAPEDNDEQKERKPLTLEPSTSVPPSPNQIEERTSVTPSVSLLHVDVISSSPVPRTGPRSVFSVFRRLAFYETNLSLAFATFTLPLSFFIIPPFAEDAGVDRLSQSFILLIAGITDIIGRLATGLLCDHYPNFRLHLYLLILMTGAVNWATVSIAPSFHTILIFNLVSSLIGAAVLTMMVPLIVQILGIAVLDVSLSAMDAVEGVFQLFVPALLSVMRKTNGSWLWGIYCGSLCFLVGAAACSRHLYHRMCGGGTAKDISDEER